VEPVGGVLVAALGGLAVAFTTLIWLGFRNGDRDDDAKTSIEAFERVGSVGRGKWARIAITNPAPTPLLVSFRYVPLERAPLAPARTVQSRTLMPWMLAEGDFALLGAVDSSATHAWELPLELGTSTRALRIEIRLDKADHRPRVQRLDLALAGPSA
jgi:hypothetical protein